MTTTHRTDTTDEIVEELLATREREFAADYPTSPEHEIETLARHLGAETKNEKYGTALLDALAAYTAVWATCLHAFRVRNRDRIRRLLFALSEKGPAEIRRARAQDMLESALADLRRVCERVGLILHAEEPVCPASIEGAMKRRAGLLPAYQNQAGRLWTGIKAVGSFIADFSLSIISGVLLVCSFMLWGFMDAQSLIAILGPNVKTALIVVVGTALSFALGWTLQTTMKDITHGMLSKGDYPILAPLRVASLAICFIAWFGQIWLDGNAAHQMAIYQWHMNNAFTDAEPAIGAWWGYMLMGAVIASIYNGIKMAKGITQGRRENEQRRIELEATPRFRVLQEDPDCKAALAIAAECSQWAAERQIASRQIERCDRLIERYQKTRWPGHWSRLQLKWRRWAVDRAWLRASRLA